MHTQIHCYMDTCMHLYILAGTQWIDRASVCVYTCTCKLAYMHACMMHGWTIARMDRRMCVCMPGEHFMQDPHAQYKKATAKLRSHCRRRSCGTSSSLHVFHPPLNCRPPEAPAPKSVTVPSITLDYKLLSPIH